MPRQWKRTMSTDRPSENGENEMDEIWEEFDKIFEKMETEIERANDDYWQQFLDQRALIADM